MRILVINGPNLEKLGDRDNAVYGSITLGKLEEIIKKEFPEHEFTFFQSNIEGELINSISSAQKYYQGIIINPGGYSHTSVALRDALELSTIPVIEVHLSNLSARENFRQNLLTASVCKGYISGFKEYSYIAGIYLLTKLST